MGNYRSRFILLVVLIMTLTGCASFSFNQPTPTPVVEEPSPHGPMVQFRTPSGRFEVVYPAGWDDAAGDDRRCRDAQKCLISRDSEFMLLREVRMPTADGEPVSLATAIDNVVANFELTTADAEFLSRTALTLDSGLPAEILRYNIENGTVSVKELWAADGDLAVSIAFITWNEGFDTLEPVADYISQTLRLATNAE